MKRFVPLQLTHLIEDGDDLPNLSWKDLGPLRILGVTQDQGNVQVELGCHAARMMLVAGKDGISLV